VTIKYGGATVRIHAVPDLELALIEDRTDYKQEDALAARSSQDMTKEENTARQELISKAPKP
jgi:hypothetical protein